MQRTTSTTINPGTQLVMGIALIATVIGVVYISLKGIRPIHQESFRAEAHFELLPLHSGPSDYGNFGS